MNDAAVWFALSAVAVTGWGYAFALALELKRLRNEHSATLEDVLNLETLLKQARKNDARDARGRYAHSQDTNVDYVAVALDRCVGH